MKKSTVIIVGIVVLILAFIIIYSLGQDESVDHMMDDGEAMMDDGEAMMDDEGSMNNEVMEDLSYSGEVLAGSVSPLINFNQGDYKKALKSDDLVVLYFFANWCPVCAEEVETALYPAFNELKEDGVVGFRVNYNDNETDDFEESLAREFGVGYQHTKVFLKGGQRILKAPDSWDKSRYLSEINSALN